MARLEIYDKFGEHKESHNIDNLREFIRSVVPDCETARPPFSAMLNGKPFPYASQDKPLTDEDLVELTIEPQSGYEIAVIIIAIAAAAYAYHVTSNLPVNDYEATSTEGESIYNANARANTPRPSGVIRSIAGAPPSIYPDLICQPHRKYVDHQEYLYLMLSVGEGHYFLKRENIYIAETPIINYSDDISPFIFEPRQTITGTIAHENWYQSLEAESINLTTVRGVVGGNWSVDASGDQFTSYLGGVATAFPFQVGERFSMTTGSNIGVYLVDSISGASSEVATVIEQKNAIQSTTLLAFQREQISRLSANISLPGSVRQEPQRTQVPTENESVTALTGVTGESVEWEGISGGARRYGPYQIIPENETCRYVEVDVVFPGGLVFYDSSGIKQNKTVELEIRYREIGTLAWTVVSSTSFTDNTYDERGYTLEIDLGGNIRPEFDFMRITPEYDTVGVSDDVYIGRVKAKLETPTKYDDITTFALEVRGSSSLSGRAENRVNIRGMQRKLPTLAEVEAAANGTPFDISNSQTRFTDNYDVSQFELITSFIIDDGLPQTVNPDVTCGFSDDGLYMAVNIANNSIKMYSLPSPFDIGGRTYLGYFTNGSGYNSKNLVIADSGNYIYKLQNTASPATTQTLLIFGFSTPYDPNEFSSVSTYEFSGAEVTDSVTGLHIRKNGTRLWIAVGTDVLQYSLSTFDSSTVSYDSVSSDFSSDVDTVISSLWFADYSGSEPTKMYLKDSGGDIHQYTMSTPGDITTASLDHTTDYSSFSGSQFQVYENTLMLSFFSSNNPSVSRFYLNGEFETRATRSLMRFVANEAYNMIGADSVNSINWDRLSTLDTLLNSRSDYLDCEFADETTLWEAMKIMLAPGYCEPALKEGALYPVRVAAGSDYVHLYTPDSMLNGVKRENSFYETQDPDGVDVEYLDEDSGEMEIVQCRLASDQGLRPKQMQVIGVINRTRAWRLGMRERRRMFYKPARYSFETEMDGLNSDYGEAIGIASDLFASQYGTVLSVSGSTVTIDFEPETTAGTYYAAFKKPEGEMSGLYEITISGDELTLVSPSSLDFTPVTDASDDDEGENTLVTLGLSTEWGKRAIMRSIQPSGEEVSLIAEEYIAAMYDSDDASPP